MDKAVLWGFSVAMYVVVGLQWSRLLERVEGPDEVLFGGADHAAYRQERQRKLFRGLIFGAGLAMIIARHFALLGR